MLLTEIIETEVRYGECLRQFSGFRAVQLELNLEFSKSQKDN